MQNCQYQDISRTLDGIQSRLSCHGHVVVSCQDDDSQMDEQTSTEIRTLCSSWPFPQLQPVLESHLVMPNEEKITSAVRALDPDPDPEPVITYGSAKNSSAAFRPRQQVVSARFSVTRTLLGEVRCSVTKYKIQKPWDVNDDEADDRKTAHYEQETSVRYIPSSHVARFGVKAFQMNTQGWQTKLRFFNASSGRVVPT